MGDLYKNSPFNDKVFAILQFYQYPVNAEDRTNDAIYMLHFMICNALMVTIPQERTRTAELAHRVQRRIFLDKFLVYALFSLVAEYDDIVTLVCRRWLQ